MNTSHWDELYRARSRLPRPTQRNAEISAGVKAQVSGFSERVLVLGVTPFFADVGSDLTGLDRIETVVRNHWPGDTPRRRAIVGDWLRLPFAAGSFSACIGDLSLNMLTYPDGVRSLYEGLARVLRNCARFVCRVYLTPDVGETVAKVTTAAWQGKARNFQYFKFRLAMAIVAERGDPTISVQSIRDVFVANFADRDRLAAATGWDRSEIDMIDFYKSSPEVYSFPTRQQSLSIIPHAFANARFVALGTYELAERCPLLVMEKV